MQKLGYISLVVRDYDEAIAFFTEKLGFRVVEDSAAIDRNGQSQTLGSGGSSGIKRNEPASGQSVHA